ncbi:unnamed protein product [Prorocentrum cordatum]|uniref:PAS domain-containing protein n=1 Tax=Prorocentrum cordatum TaxID=2364126 RepID=A0ABN9STD3_9DINO|nr:unnamed protein product [Polarella glacialis]
MPVHGRIDWIRRQIDAGRLAHVCISQARDPAKLKYKFMSESGEIAGVVGTFEDPTMVNWSLKAHSDLIGQANAMVFALDLDGLVTEWNAQACQISGLPREAMLRQSLQDKVPTEAGALRQALAAAKDPTEGRASRSCCASQATSPCWSVPRSSGVPPVPSSACCVWATSSPSRLARTCRAAGRRLTKGMGSRA